MNFSKFVCKRNLSGNSESCRIVELKSGHFREEEKNMGIFLHKFYGTTLQSFLYYNRLRIIGMVCRRRLDCTLVFFSVLGGLNFLHYSYHAFVW